MRKAAHFAALIAALFCFTSCGGVIDALLNHYMVGNQMVIVGKAEFSTSALGGYSMIFHSSDDESTDMYAITIPSSKYSAACEDEIDITDFIVSASAGNQSQVIRYLGPSAAEAIGWGAEYSQEPVKVTGKLRVREGSAGFCSVNVKANITLAQKKNPAIKRDFCLDLLYNGTPERK